MTTISSKQADASLLEVRLSDGTRWRGTQAQLRRVHPDWLPYAHQVGLPVTRADVSATVPYESHSASLHPEDMPPYTTDEQAAEEEDDLSGYPDERHRLAPPSAVRTMQSYQSYPATRVDVHEGPPPLVRRASRRQPHPKRPAPDEGVVYQMPSAGGWRQSDPEAPPTTQAGAKKRHPRRRRSVHPLLFLGVGMVLMFVLWLAATGLASWWQLHQDDVTYGRPRTFQTDAVVGHFDSVAHPSHFVAENLHRRVVIFELPGGDASKARVYVGPLLYGPGADLAPVTLSFPLIGGRTAMVVTVQGNHLVYLNKQVRGVWLFVQQQG